MRLSYAIEHPRPRLFILKSANLPLSLLRESGVSLKLRGMDSIIYTGLFRIRHPVQLGNDRQITKVTMSQ